MFLGGLMAFRSGGRSRQKSAGRGQGHRGGKGQGNGIADRMENSFRRRFD